jgi:hypothetical protein
MTRTACVKLLKSFGEMVGDEGFEPPTTCV